MTPEEELVSYGTRDLSRERYLKIRRHLRKYEFYAIRVIGPRVIKKKCTNREISEHHGYICNPTDWEQRLGFTMFIVKDDDPCSMKRLLTISRMRLGWWDGRRISTAS